MSHQEHQHRGARTITTDRSGCVGVCGPTHRAANYRRPAVGLGKGQGMIVHFHPEHCAYIVIRGTRRIGIFGKFHIARIIESHHDLHRLRIDDRHLIGSFGSATAAMNYADEEFYEHHTFVLRAMLESETPNEY